MKGDQRMLVFKGVCRNAASVRVRWGGLPACSFSLLQCVTRAIVPELQAKARLLAFLLFF